MIVLLIFGIIGIIFGLYLTQTSKEDPRIRLGGRVVSGIGVLLIVISIIISSFAAIPAGHRGVVIRFSAVTGTIMNEGLHLKVPFLD